MERFAIDRGWRAESKWRNLPTDEHDEYLADKHPDRQWFVEFLQLMAPCKVLEIGAGSLHEARSLFERTPTDNIDYTVVDVAKNAIESGRREFPMIHFIEGDVNRLRLPDDAFDVVYCRHVLEHQPYYQRPILEMLRVSRRLVVINLFRWSLHRDLIRREKYYSNSYQIDDFLAFIAGRSEGYEHFLVQKEHDMGKNMYEDCNIRRTGDHLVVVAAKHVEVSSYNVYEPLDLLGATYVPHPYDGVEIS